MYNRCRTGSRSDYLQGLFRRSRIHRRAFFFTHPQRGTSLLVTDPTVVASEARHIGHKCSESSLQQRLHLVHPAYYQHRGK